MKTSEMFPSKYMGKDCLASPIVATIDSTWMEDIKGKNGMQRKPVISFMDQELKPMILNVTNTIMLESLYGNDSDHWRGRQIEIYYDPNVMNGLERTGGIRLRQPAGPAPARQVPAPAPGLMDFSQATAACAAAGISRDELVAALKARGLTCYNAVRDTMMVQQMIADKARLAQPAADEDFGGTPGGDLDADGNPLPF